MGGGHALGAGAPVLCHGRGLRGAPAGERPTCGTGKPSESTIALAAHAAHTRFAVTVGPGLDSRGGTAVRSEEVHTPSCCSL